MTDRLTRSAGVLGAAMALGAMHMLTPTRIERRAAPKPVAKTVNTKAKAQRKARKITRRSRK